MKTITLSKGFIAKVDDADYDNLIQYPWYAHKSGDKYGDWYAATGSHPRKSMHSMLIECPVGMHIDHADGDTMNNQRDNLRIATVSQNSANRKMSSTKKGVQYLGVHMRKRDGKFYGICEKDKKRYNTGYYLTVEEAVLERNKLAVKLHGEFAPIQQIKT